MNSYPPQARIFWKFTEYKYLFKGFTLIFERLKRFFGAFHNRVKPPIVKLRFDLEGEGIHYSRD